MIRRLTPSTFKEVHYCEPPVFEKQPVSPAQAMGNAYERKVKKELTRRYSTSYEVKDGPWIRHTKGVRQPDVVMVPKDPNAPILVVEVKLSSQKSVRTKLRSIYIPLVQALYPDRQVLGVQVYKREKDKIKAPAIKLRDLHLTAYKYSVVHHLL